MDMINGLNPQQQQAVQAGLGPVLVMAGPGSGKTRVLTQRTAYLIAHLGVKPYNLLAVTFTNKAAKEMGKRVATLLNQQTRGLSLGTFHSICAGILRREAAALPFKSNFVIFDSNDQLSITKSAIKDLDLDDKQNRPSSIHSAISRAKNELIFPDEYPTQTYRDDVVKIIYHRYQEILLSSNALDFDDLLLWTAFLLDDNSSIRRKYAHRYEHILVDEFQDTNMVQYLLLKHLSSFHRNIFVVGDSDQSIYRWRGADYRNILRFEKDFPDSQVILLEQNYRSTQAILDVAMAVIDRNPQRTPKRLFTDRGMGNKVVITEKYDDRDEANYIIETIVRAVRSHKAELGHYAIMYRTNAQSRVIEEAFLNHGIVYKLVGAQRFYGRREIKDLVAYFRLVQNSDDEVSLFRIINRPTRGIGNKTLNLLKTAALNNKMTSGELLLDLAKGKESDHWTEFPNRASTVLMRFAKMLLEWGTDINNLTPLNLMDKIIADIQYRTYIDDGTEEGQDRWENVNELRRLAMEYDQLGLESFLENIALVSDQDTIGENTNAPTLLTLHAAKGLEFPNIFIIGLNDGTLPHFRSFDDTEAMQEERRLLYVGITRAQDNIYLSHTEVRYTFGYSEPSVRSQFLNDLPTELLEDGTGGYNLNRHKKTSYHWTRSSDKSEEKIEPKYFASMKVNHPVWGDGMVINSSIDGNDEILDILFETVGLKKVIAGLAKLNIKS